MKTIFVTGATGNQGGAVAASLIKNGFKIKVLTRKTDSVIAQKYLLENPIRAGMLRIENDYVYSIGLDSHKNEKELIEIDFV